MKPWIKRTLIAVTGATLALGALSACGHRGEHRHGGWSEERVTEMRGKAIERVSSKLELNAEQKQKLGLLADEMLAARKAVKGDSAQPREELKALIASDRFDRSRAQQLMEQKTQAVQATSPKVIEAMANFYDSLTPTQQAQVRELMDKRRGWRRG
jgi:protein CpxP